MHSVNIPAGHVTHQISNDHYWEMNYSKYCNCTYDPQRYKWVELVYIKDWFAAAAAVQTKSATYWHDNR